MAVAALVAGMGLAIKATFKWADELDSLQDVMGVSNETAAAFNFILRKSGVSTETLTKATVILSKGLVKADGSLDATGKSLKTWGINVLDANGMLKDQTTLIGEISDKYASFGTQQEKVNFLTETFGRSGAELIDFFDTLAADGGIDVVAEKVERLGLAIDPNRYEQFNRNLEELKLVGLGLAVGFTEKVMPAIEKFLEIISDPNLTVGDFAAKVDKFIGGMIENMADSIDNWVSSGGPEELTDKIVSWVENLGEGEGAQSKILAGAQHLLEAIATALTEIDWSAIGTTIETKVNETFAVMDPAIRTSLDTIDATFNEWLAGEPVAWMDQLDTTLNEGTMTALGNAAINISNWETDTTATVAAWEMGVNTIVDTWAAGMQEKFSTWAAGVNTTVDTWAATTTTKYQTWAAGVNTTVNTWAAGVLATYNTWATNVNSTVDTALTTLGNKIFDKLTGIAKTFYNGATGWTAQAAKGFLAGVGTITNAVQGIVNTINGILKQIITSFTFSFNMGALPGSGSTGGGNRPRNSPRASGGPVSARSAYMVGEMGPELFVPSNSGSIVPNNQLGQQQTVVATIDEARLARTIVTALMSAQGGAG